VKEVNTKSHISWESSFEAAWGFRTGWERGMVELSEMGSADGREVSFWGNENV
jgi:hypothetical protein